MPPQHGDVLAPMRAARSHLPAAAAPTTAAGTAVMVLLIAIAAFTVGVAVMLGVENPGYFLAVAR